jgi:MFS family permease
MAADRSPHMTPAGTPLKRVVLVLFAATGFSALCLQVVWQRVISIHGGVDLFSSATVVAAFMAGLGLGNLVGGALADRFGARRSILAFAIANFGIGVFGWASIAIFYDGYRAFAEHVQSLPAALLLFALAGTHMLRPAAAGSRASCSASQFHPASRVAHPELATQRPSAASVQPRSGLHDPLHESFRLASPWSATATCRSVASLRHAESRPEHAARAA